MCNRTQAAYDACDNGFNTLRKHAGGCWCASVVHAPRCAIAVQAAAAPQCEYARSSPQTCLILPRVCSYLHARLIQPGTHAWLQAVCRHAAGLVISTGIPAWLQAVRRHVAGLVIGHWHPAWLQAVWRHAAGLVIGTGIPAWLQAVQRHVAGLLIGTSIPACLQAVWRHVAGLVIGHWHPLMSASSPNTAMRSTNRLRPRHISPSGQRNHPAYAPPHAI